MGKLIDTDYLKLRLKNLHLLATSGYGAEEVVGKILDEMPEGVVRCKDCKHRDKYECNYISLGGTKCGVTDDWFCADGERSVMDLIDRQAAIDAVQSRGEVTVYANR